MEDDRNVSQTSITSEGGVSYGMERFRIQNYPIGTSVELHQVHAILIQVKKGIHTDWKVLNISYLLVIEQMVF